MKFDAKETAKRLRNANAGKCININILEAFVDGFSGNGACFSCDECDQRVFDAIADALDPCDTQERIDGDALKPIGEYWGCYGKDCDECPVTVDGKTPYQRYGLDMINCHAAKTLDLLRRQRELDGRAG